MAFLIWIWFSIVKSVTYADQLGNLNQAKLVALTIYNLLKDTHNIIINSKMILTTCQEFNFLHCLNFVFN